MSNFDNDKIKTAAIEETAYLVDEELDDDEELEEIEIDTELFAEQLLRFPCFQSALSLIHI